VSRTSTIEQMTVGKRKNALEFHWDSLWAPPIMSLFTPEDINELISIAKSIRYAGNVSKKYDLIDSVMKRRGFRRAHCGTNRICYHFLESSVFVAKVAVDSVGMTDSPAEYINQDFFKPFCCKIFEVHPSGVIAFIERVNPISSIEEFISVKDDIFNLMITKIIGKYVVDDLGAKSYMNFGVRQMSNGVSFGPVIIDFPYVYETDGAKLTCMHAIQNINGFYEPCGGDIDYDAGFNKLYCTKCGREYRAIDLAKAKDNNEIKFEYSDKDRQFAEKIRPMIRAQIIEYDGTVVYDSGRKSKRYISKEDFIMSTNMPEGSIKVSKVHRQKRESIQDVRKRFFSDLQIQYYTNMKDNQPFNPVVEQQVEKAQTVKPNKTDNFNGDPYAIQHIDNYQEMEIVPEYIPNPAFKVKVRKTHFPDGTTVRSDEQIATDLDGMESTVFPEINNVVSVEEAVEEHKESTEAADSDGKQDAEMEHQVFAQERKSGQIISDEEFGIMLDGYKKGNASETVEEESSIIDPTLDTNPLNNPIIRPYGDATHSVYYTPPKENIVNPIDIAEAISTTDSDDESDDDSVKPTSDIKELLKVTTDNEYNQHAEEEESESDYESEYAQVEDTYDRQELQDLEKTNKRKKYVTNKRRH